MTSTTIRLPDARNAVAHLDADGTLYGGADEFNLRDPLAHVDENGEV